MSLEMPPSQEQPSVKPEAKPFSAEATDRSMPTKEMNFYERLGVLPGASPAEIKRAYRVCVRSYHPDTNPGNKEAEEAFKLIQEAYDILFHSPKRLGDNQPSSEVETSRSERASHEMPGGTAESLSRLRTAWQKYGRLQPTPKYYKSLEKEFPDYIDSETKVVELLPQLDKVWSTFRSETGLNISLPEGYYEYLVRNHSTLWITREIEKIHLLLELNSLLADKNPDENKKRQDVLRYFLDNWQGPSGSKSSIETAINRLKDNKN